METKEPIAPTTTEQWEQTLAQLRAENEDLRRRRTDAEKDRDLFRDLYGKASAHATAVTTENNELAERGALAEGQARDGVALVRATYDARVRALEQDVARWRGQAQVLAARDARSDDDVRRRAALEPELRAENERLNEQLRMLEEDYRNLEALFDSLAKQQNEETAVLESAAMEPVLTSQIE